MREPPPERDAAGAATPADAIEGPNRHSTEATQNHRSGDGAPSARAADPWTSHAAQRDPEGHRARKIDLYVVSAAAAGKRGVNADDLKSKHGGETSCVCRRITDMVRLGWLRHEGERRSRRTGRWQRTYVATAAGHRQAARVIAATAKGAA